MSSLPASRLAIMIALLTCSLVGAPHRLLAIVSDVLRVRCLTFSAAGPHLGRQARVGEGRSPTSGVQMVASGESKQTDHPAPLTSP
eukprot:355101-Chlamydomonas_euryale.AAC.1